MASWLPLSYTDRYTLCCGQCTSSATSCRMRCGISASDSFRFAATNSRPYLRADDQVELPPGRIAHEMRHTRQHEQLHDEMRRWRHWFIQTRCDLSNSPPESWLSASVHEELQYQTSHLEGSAGRGGVPVTWQHRRIGGTAVRPATSDVASPCIGCKFR